MSPVGFELTFSAGERPQNYALDRTATGTGENPHVPHENPLQMSEIVVWCSVAKNEFLGFLFFEETIGLLR
jgi:hypothetical protein